MHAEMQLIDLLTERLMSHGYEAVEGNKDTGRTPDLSVLKTQRRYMMSYVCALVRIPPDVNNIRDLKQLHRKIRTLLAKRYAHFPWFKELGTFTIYVCAPELFERVRNELSQFNDKTGLHVNTMLATWVVSRKTFDAAGQSTWGLFSRAAQTVGVIGAVLAEFHTHYAANPLRH